MRYLFLFASLFFISACRQEKKTAKAFPVKVEMLSPKSDLSLDIDNGHFVLEHYEFASDQVFSTAITTGTYSIDGDLMVLQGSGGKRFTLRIETEEMLMPVDFDTLSSSSAFLAWNSFYANGNIQQQGGWTEDNRKDGVWSFYNDSGTLINQKLYEKGSVVDDDFKFK